MPYPGRKWRPIITLAVWVVGLLLYLGLGWWNLEKSREDFNARLTAEAGQMAGQLAALLSLPAWNLDELSAHIVVAGAMEDERIYAISIHGPSGLLDGQRRNYLWEPVPWDGELTENCVQGIAPVRADGQLAGRVEIWLSPRLGSEELAMLKTREMWRFFLVAFFWTAAFAGILWIQGDLRPARVRSKNPGAQGDAGSETGAGNPEPEEAEAALANRQTPGWQGRDFANPGIRIPVQLGARLFAHVFRNAPQLIDQLYAAGAWAQLSHLGRLIEQAAVLVGAPDLSSLAREMQNSLNDPQGEMAASAADRLSAELQDMLSAEADCAAEKRIE